MNNERISFTPKQWNYTSAAGMEQTQPNLTKNCIGPGNVLHYIPDRTNAVLRPRPHWCVFAYRPHYNAKRFHRKRIHLKTLSGVETFENEAKRKCVSVDSENGGFRNADVIRLFVTCADDYNCSVFERCVFKRKRSSVDGENAAKTIVWTDEFLVKTERLDYIKLIFITFCTDFIDQNTD